MDIKGALTRPLGPLPAWAWGVVIAGGYLLYHYLKTGSLFGSGTAAATTTDAVVPASDYGSGATGSGGTSTSTGGFQPSGVSTPWNDLWDTNHSLIPADWVAWLNANVPDYLNPQTPTSTTGNGNPTTTALSNVVTTPGTYLTNTSAKPTLNVNV